jgi:DNA-binding response OmpR family regulator
MGQPIVLLVEDERSIRELVADVLRDEGYAVVEAQDGVEAIHALDEYSLQACGLALVVMDMMLPGTDGLAVLDYLGELRGDLPVVAMSASRRQLAAAVGAGACAVLYKPFDLDELIGVVAGHCAPCNHAPATRAASRSTRPS